MTNWIEMPNYLRYGGRDLRVSDAERTEVTDILSRHYGDGRLDHSEFDARVDAAMHAKTRSELSRVLTDLPRLDAPADPVRRRAAPPFAFFVVFALIAAITATAMLHAVVHAVPLWPFVLLAVFLLVRGRRRGYHGHRGYRGYRYDGDHRYPG